MTSKPLLENIQPSFGSSFTVKKYTEEQYSTLPYWHCHPEYEIVFITNGKGKRQIGGHISYYEEGDLVFLGPNIPHLGFTQDLYEQHVEVVVQMKEDFLGKDFLKIPEMANVRQLFERSKSGLAFSGYTKWIAGERLDGLVDLDPLDKLLTLLKILDIMAKSTEFQTLDINYLSVEVKPQEHLRMKKVYDFVEENFARQFSLEEIAAVVNMTEPAFCRFFKKLTHKTFITFLNEFRIAFASRLLAEEHLSISAVSFESGFNNLSYFNKQFKVVTGKTASEYRKQLRKFILSEISTELVE